MRKHSRDRYRKHIGSGKRSSACRSNISSGSGKLRGSSFFRCKGIRGR